MVQSIDITLQKAEMLRGVLNALDREPKLDKDIWNVGSNC